MIRGAQFSQYSWVALTHEFTPSTKTNDKRFSFLTATYNRRPTKLHPHEYSNKSTIHENCPPPHEITSPRIIKQVAVL